MKDNLVNINIVGDLFSDSNIDYTSIENVFKTYSSRDIPLILNLEGSINFHSSILQTNKAVYLSLDISLLDIISKYNIVVSLANNHSLDFGNQSLKRLLGLLEERSIDYFGLKEDSDISKIYKFLGHDNYGNQIIIAGSGWSNEQVITNRQKGFSCIEFDYESSKNILEHIRFHYPKSKVIMYAHFGYEYEFWPLPIHVELSRKLIEIGYSAIIGSHSHTVQAFEKWQQSPIYYGLGNLFFNSKKIKHSDKFTYGRLVTFNLERNIFDTESIITKQNILNHSIEMLEDNANFDCININLSEYSKAYKYIRIRQRNPRPILYPDKLIYNFLIYNIWKLIVQFLGLINCRSFVKRLLSW